MRRVFRVGLVLLAACGGTPPGTPPPTFEPVRQTIGALGGTVSVPAEGGTLALEIPPGALDRDVAFVITPLAGAEFSVAPLDVALRVPATLRFVATAAIQGQTSFYWSLGGARSFVLSTLSGTTLTASVDRIAPGPLAAASGLRASADGDGSATLGRAPIDCDAESARLTAALQSAASRNDLPRAIAISDSLEALRATCTAQKIMQVTAQACAAYSAALRAVNTTTVTDEPSFRGLIIPLLGAAAHVAAAGGDCDISGVDAALERGFRQLIAALETEIADPAFASEFVQRRLVGLVGLEAECNLLDLPAPICEKFPNDLYPPVLDLLRNQAYQDCLDDQTALSLSQLYRAGPEPRVGSFFGKGRFSFAALEDDVLFCTNPSLDAAVFKNADSVPEPVPALAQHLDMRGSPGAPMNVLNISVPRSGSFNLTGQLRALACPDTRVSADEVVFRIGTAEIARRPQSDNTFALDTAPLDFVIKRDVVRAGLDPETVQSFDVQATLEGPGCSGVFNPAHDYFRVHVTVLESGLTVSPATASSPQGSSLQFEARLDGTSTTDVQWRASGGSITSAGVWTAPRRDGTVHITATYNPNMRLTATATVEVSGASEDPVRWAGTLEVNSEFTFGWDTVKHSGCFFAAPNSTCDRHLSGTGSGSLHFSLNVETSDVLPLGFNVPLVITGQNAASGSITMTSAVDETYSDASGCVSNLGGTSMLSYQSTDEFPTFQWLINVGASQVIVTRSTFAKSMRFTGTTMGNSTQARNASCPGGAVNTNSMTPPAMVNDELVGMLEGMVIELPRAPGSLSDQTLQGSPQLSVDNVATACTGSIINLPDATSATCHAINTVTWNLHRQ